ncbi:hypothetical protein EIN_212270, partial [Entamoeba invadens IP1]
MPSKKEEIASQLADLTARIVQIESSISLISSRMIQNELVQKDLQHQITDVTTTMANLVQPVKSPIPKQSYQPFLDDLKRFTEKETCTVIYDSNKDGMTSR